MQIIIGSDHGGFKLKEEIADYLKTKGITVFNAGTYSTDSCDYPVIAKDVAKKVLATPDSKGILVCGTGIGICIAANKVRGIRAAHCTDTYSARMTVQHNNSNILCLGERVTATGLALDIVDAWLNAKFESGRHQKRIDMIEEL